MSAFGFWFVRVSMDIVVGFLKKTKQTNKLQHQQQKHKNPF